MEAMREASRNPSTTSAEDIGAALTAIGPECAGALTAAHGEGFGPLHDLYKAAIKTEQDAQRDAARARRLDHCADWPPPGLLRGELSCSVSSASQPGPPAAAALAGLAARVERGSVGIDEACAEAQAALESASGSEDPGGALEPAVAELQRLALHASRFGAVKFVSDHEVELRRIAQLCDSRFHDAVKIGFCSGGVEEERRHVLTRLARQTTLS